MKKLIVLVILIFLFGCNSVDKEKVFDEYNNAYNSFNSIQSFNVSMDSKYNISRKLNKDSKDVLEIINHSVLGDLSKEGNNYSSYYLSSLDNIKTWYIDKIVYMDNGGFKISYKDNLQNYFNQTKLYYSIIPIELLKEDIKEIKKSTIIDGFSYEFVLKKSGSLKLVKSSVFNNIGYDYELFKIEDINSSYIVDIVNGNIESINIIGDLSGEFINEYMCIDFSSDIKYRNINSTIINIPDGLEEFSVSDASTSIYSIKNLEDYKHYLLKVGYSKIDDYTYSIKLNDNAKYVYDFENKIYSYVYNNNTYVYDWNKDYGYNNTYEINDDNEYINLCVYDFKNDSVLEGQCNNSQIFYLKVNKNSFMYDINNSNITDYSVFDK